MPIVSQLPFPPDQLAICAHREVLLRVRVYSRLVRSHQISEADPKLEINMMSAFAHHFDNLDHPNLL